MTFKRVRTGVRILAVGAVAYVAMGVAYVACVVVACW